MSNTITQLNPPIPLMTMKGRAVAHFIIDYGMEIVKGLLKNREEDHRDLKIKKMVIFNLNQKNMLKIFHVQQNKDLDLNVRYAVK
jgi:hypothetical protein